MNYEDYVHLNYKPKDSDLICEFYAEPSKKNSLKKVAGAVASESSVGTWTEVTTSTKNCEKISAKVYEIDFENKTFKIAYPIELFEPGNMPQILSSISGNIFGMKILDKLRLLDVCFPEKIVKSFKGPEHGLLGVRKKLQIKDRPLIGTIVKPKLGLNAKQHAEVAFNAWIGGCDIVKDDENLSSMKFNKFKERILETLKKLEKAEKITGEKKMYMPNITSETMEMIRRMKFVKDNGGICVMVDIMTVGWAALQTVRNYNQNFKLIIHAHRAGHATLTREKRHGISMLTIAKIARLIGVDQLHIGTIVGKMHGGEEIPMIAQEIKQKLIKSQKRFVKRIPILEQNWFNIKPVFAVCSGGLNPLHVPYLINKLGKDIIMQFGGGIHGHKMGTTSGAVAVRQAIDATLKEISLKEYSLNHKELAEALKQWSKEKS